MRASFGLTSLSILAVLAAGALAACNTPYPGLPNFDSGTTAGTGEGSTGTGSTTGAGVGGGTSSTASSTASGTGGAPDYGPYPAPHPSMPQIPNHGGAVLHDPVIVTVTFPNDDLEAKAQALDDQIGSLKWWSTVHKGYGVGPATGGGHVTMKDDLPSAMSDGDVENWLQDRITDGTLPAPTDQMIYALYIPASTTVTFSAQAGGGSSCQEWLGYHSSINASFQNKVIPAAYAVIGRCGTIDDVTDTASHEFTEAATDPHPIAGIPGYVLEQNTPWTILGGEDGDMCSGVSPVSEAGWNLTRVWNNESALEGNQPCLPVPDPINGQVLPYFNAGLVKDTLKGTVGGTVSVEVDCYSFGPLPGPMTLVGQAFSKKSALTFSFSQPTCNNGDKVMLTINVAATAKHGTDYHFSVLAQLDPNNGHTWRGMVSVK
jgi:hypothetical protein